MKNLPKHAGTTRSAERLLYPAVFLCILLAAASFYLFFQPVQSARWEGSAPVFTSELLAGLQAAKGAPGENGRLSDVGLPPLPGNHHSGAPYVHRFSNKLISSATLSKASEPSVQRTQDAPIPDDQAASTPEIPSAQEWISIKVRKGDSLSRIFSRNGFDTAEAYAIANHEQGKALLMLRPGQIIKLKRGPDGQLSQLRFELGPTTLLDLQMTNEPLVYQAEILESKFETKIRKVRGIIHNSLLGTAKLQGIPYGVMEQFIQLFGWQVDFSTDIRKNDRFSIIYQEIHYEEGKVGSGDIMAAELVLSRDRLRAIHHEDEEGRTDYFAPDGSGIKGEFLRSPLKFANITSNFSKSRLHPIKKIWKAHRGVDYGAPTGTPVMATGDGVVVQAGRNGSYGKRVMIRHGNRYETVYAHLSRYAKGIKRGTRVGQGEVIGYVGSTGLSTGPHLHYEFRVNGVHKDPVTVDLPKSAPISKDALEEFRKNAGTWVRELENLEVISLASNE